MTDGAPDPNVDVATHRAANVEASARIVEDRLALLSGEKLPEKIGQALREGLAIVMDRAESSAATHVSQLLAGIARQVLNVAQAHYPRVTFQVLARDVVQDAAEHAAQASAQPPPKKGPRLAH